MASSAGSALLGGVGGEGGGLGSGLRATVGDDREPSARRLEEQLERPPALVGRQQDALPCRPQHEQAVAAAVGEEGDVGRKRGLVERAAVVAQRRDRRRKRAAEPRRRHGRHGLEARAAHAGRDQHDDRDGDDDAVVDERRVVVAADEAEQHTR